MLERVVFAFVLFLWHTSDGCALSTPINASNFNIGVGYTEYLVPNQYCVWTLTAPPAMVHHITATITLSANSNDRVFIYDGSGTSAPLLAPLYGKLAIDPNYNVAYYSKSNVITVEFQTDNLPRKLNATGFQLVSAATSPVAYCQGTRVINATNTLVSIMEPAVGGPYYPAPCQWLFTATPGYSVEVGFTIPTLAAGDSFVVYDGDTTNAPVLGATSWEDSRFASTGRSLLVAFRPQLGDKSATASFNMTCQAIPATQCSSTPLLINVTELAYGSIKQPSERETFILPNVICRWRVVFPADSYVLFMYNYEVRRDGTFVPVNFTVYDGSTVWHAPAPNAGVTNTSFAAGSSNIIVEYYAGPEPVFFALDYYVRGRSNPCPFADYYGDGSVTTGDLNCYLPGRTCISILRPYPGSVAKFQLVDGIVGLAPGDTVTVVDVRASGNVTLGTIVNGGMVNTSSFVASEGALMLVTQTAAAQQCRTGQYCGALQSYLANPPSCSGNIKRLNASLATTTLTVPNNTDFVTYASYASPQTCRWTIVRGPGSGFKMEMDMFSFAADDSLTLSYLGTTLAQFVGGYVGNSVYYYNVPALNVTFSATSTSRFNVDPAIGFSATFTPLTVTRCGGMNNITGSVRLQSYGDRNLAPYQNENCVFYYTSTPGMGFAASLDVIRGVLPAGMRLVIWDGLPGTGTLIANCTDNCNANGFGPLATIIFTTDGTPVDPLAQGFCLSVSPIQLPVYCAGLTTFSGDMSISLADSSYWGWRANMSCQWIYTPGGSQLPGITSIVVPAAGAWSGRLVVYDYVGNLNASTVLYDSNWPGAAQLSSVLARSGSAYVSFSTPPGATGSMLSTPICFTATGYTKPFVCTGRTEFKVGIIGTSSANIGRHLYFARDSNHPLPHGHRCEFIVRSFDGSWLELQDDVNIKPGDSISVYGGETTASPFLFNITGNNDKNFYVIQGSVGLIVYESGGSPYDSTSVNGYIDFGAYSGPNFCSGHQDIYLVDDTVQSFSYPENYPSQMPPFYAPFPAGNCSWTLHGLPGRFFSGSSIRHWLGPRSSVRIIENGVELYHASGIVPSGTGFTPACGTVTIELVVPETNSFDFGFQLTYELVPFGDSYVFPMVCRPSPFAGVCGGNADGLFPPLINSTAQLRQMANCTVYLGELDICPTIGMSIDLPNLYSIDNLHVDGPISNGTRLPRLQLANQITWNGVAPNDELTFPALKYATSFSSGTLHVASLKLPALESMTMLSIGGSDFTKEISAPNVKMMHTIAVADMDALERVDVGMLNYVYTASITGSQRLQYINFTGLSSAYTLSLTGLGLESLALGAQAVHCLSLFQIPMTELLTPNLISAETITLNGLAVLASWHAPALENVGDLTSTSNVGIIDFVLPVLYTADSITLSSNEPLITASLPALFFLEDCFESTSNSIKSISLPQAKYVKGLKLGDNAFLESLDLCQNNNLLASPITDEPSLSCSDLNGLLATMQSGYMSFTSPNCNPGITGKFGCQYNVVNEVDVATCGNTLACIQASIDASFSGQNISVHVPAGEYIGCTAPLDFGGKIITLYGDGIGVTKINCKGSGTAINFATQETAPAVVRGISFMNGVASSGGILTVNDASPTFIECEFVGGLALLNGGAVVVTGAAAPSFTGCIFRDSFAGANGGGLYVSGASVTLVNCAFYNTSASTEGGGVYASSTITPPLLSGTSVVGCAAARGGGVFSDSAINLLGARLLSNVATQFGGGLAVVPTQPLGVACNLTAVTIANNRAPTGAGLYSFSADVYLTHGNVSGNVALSTDGGGAFITCSASYRFLNDIQGSCDVRVVVAGTTVAGNSAKGNGGGLVLRDVQADISGSSVFNGNTATLNGGGVYACATALTMSNSMVMNNAALQSGGGVYCEPLSGSCSISTSTFDSNAAVVGGGGVFLCTAACPGVNYTTGASIQFGSLPNLMTTNTFTNNLFGDPTAYGKDVATDPSRLTWLVAPAPVVVSGRTVINTTAPVTVLVTDGYGQTVTSSSATLALSLFTLLPDGVTSATDRVTISGAQTVLATRGVATFPGITLVATSVSYADACYLLQCRLSLLSSVSLVSPVQLTPCLPGQGKADGTDQVVCSDCAAGYQGSSATGFTCVACSPGSYAATALSASCTQCPAGSSAALAGATACQPCPDGYEAQLPGAAECTSTGALTAGSNALAPALGGSLAALALLAALAALYVWRLARARTMKKYYLDADSTVRTGAIESPLQRAVKKMIVAASTTRIGGGVYADIYKARYQDRWIALKVLKGEMVGNSVAIAEFRRETVALTRLNERLHPGIIRLEFLLQRNPMCIGEEYCPNGTVKRALLESISLERKVTMIAEAASGMTVMHALNIAHLDLKTDNLLVDEHGHIKIADFGISRTVGGESVAMPTEYSRPEDTTNFSTVKTNNSSDDAPPPLPGRGVTTTAAAPPPPVVAPSPAGMNSGISSVGGGVGTMQAPSRSTSIMEGIDVDTAFTPQYVDPMRIVQDKPNDITFLRQADMFSFGVVMWAILAEREPYAGEEPQAVMEQLKANPRQRLPQASGPEYLTSIITRTWNDDRSQRPSFIQLLAELKEVLRREFRAELLPGYAEPNFQPYTGTAVRDSSSGSVTAGAMDSNPTFGMSTNPMSTFADSRGA